MLGAMAVFHKVLIDCQVVHTTLAAIVCREHTAGRESVRPRDQATVSCELILSAYRHAA